MLIDTMQGCGALAGFAAEAAGEDDRYAGACDDEVAGAIAAWDRVEAYAAARKLAAVAEFIRRRPEPGVAPRDAAAMPETWDEFTTVEVAGLLAESRPAADTLLGLAYDVAVRLPGTAAAFRDGILRQSKVAIIARATALLDPAEARVVRDHDRPAGTRRRSRLRPARTQEAPEASRARDARRAGILLRGHGRTGDLAAPRPWRRTGPAGHPRPDRHQRLRPPIRGQGP
jgi:hypothetical protein